MISILQGSLSLGLLWSFMAIGVYITYRVLEMPDLSAEGSIILGAGLAARFISTGYNPIVATLLAMVVGSLAGFVTGILHTKLEIPPILAGILTMIASYSVVIRIMGTSNIALLRIGNVFTPLIEVGLSNRNAAIVLGITILVLICSFLYWFFGTELGAAIRATGNNKNMARALGINIDAMIIIALMISNGMIALGGALVAQNQGHASVDMGAGTIIIGLASVIIAEVLLKVKSFWARLASLVVGATIYRIIIALVLEMGMPPTDLRLFTSITVAVALTLPLIQKKLRSYYARSKQHSQDISEGNTSGKPRITRH